MKQPTYIAGSVIGALFLSIAGSAAYADTACTNLSANVSRGTPSSHHSDIVVLQDFLRDSGYLSYQSTGYFGVMTLQAVKKFQADHGLPSTGYVGPMTRDAIQKISCASNVPAPTISTSTPVPMSTSQSQLQSAAAAQAFNMWTSTTTSQSQSAPHSDSFPLPYHSDAFSNSFKDWQQDWGTVSLNADGTLQVNASSTTTGGEAILPHSGDWTDYRYSAQVTISSGIIILIGRYIDDDNYIACVFDGNTVAIKQHLNGDSSELNSTVVDGLPAAPVVSRATSVSLHVHGTTAGCSAFGSDDNITATIDPLLNKGGIGIETWQDGLGVARLQLQSIDVQ